MYGKEGRAPSNGGDGGCGGLGGLAGKLIVIGLIETPNITLSINNGIIIVLTSYS